MLTCCQWNFFLFFAKKKLKGESNSPTLYKVGSTPFSYCRLLRPCLRHYNTRRYCTGYPSYRLMDPNICFISHLNVVLVLYLFVYYVKQETPRVSEPYRWRSGQHARLECGRSCVISGVVVSMLASSVVDRVSSVA